MPLDYVLIVSLGRSDVQVVDRSGQGRARRHPLRKKWVRAVHQDCLDGKIRYRVTPLEQTAELQPRDHQGLEYVRDCGTLVGTETFDSRSRVELAVDRDLELCAPLLADAWLQIQEKVERGQLGKAKYVLLLNTRRDDLEEKGQPREAGEPIAVGTIVRSVVAEALGLTDDLVVEYMFLEHGDLYEMDARNQRHLRSDAARRIDQQVHELRRRFPDALPLISDIGGFPETKAVLAASVSFRFEGRFEFVRPVERDRAVTHLKTVVIPAAESLHTRQQIVRLIRRGCFDAAAELAQHPLGDEALRSEPWRRSVIAAARFLRSGQLADCAGQIHDQLSGLLDQPRSVVVLFRIEAALRRGDLENAVCDTVTFGELALLELIEKHLSQPGMTCVDWEALEIVRDKCLLEYQNHNREEYYRLQDQRDRHTMSSWLPEPVQAAWKRVNKAVRRRVVSDARNAATHAHVSQASIEAAANRLEDEGLWKMNRDWRTILGANGLRDLLAALGTTDARDRYRWLVDALCCDIDELTEPEAESMP